MRINLNVQRISGSFALIWPVPSFLTQPSSSCWNDCVRLEVRQPTSGSKDEEHVRMVRQKERRTLCPWRHPKASIRRHYLGYLIMWEPCWLILIWLSHYRWVFVTWTEEQSLTDILFSVLWMTKTLLQFLLWWETDCPKDVIYIFGRSCTKQFFLTQYKR